MNKNSEIRTDHLANLIQLKPRVFKTNPNVKNRHFVGFGGAGCNMIYSLYKLGLEGKYTAISSPCRKHVDPDIPYIYFAHPDSKDKEEKVKMNELGKTDFNLLLKEIDKIFDDCDEFFLFAGLGGLTGTFLINRYISKLESNGKSFKSICSLPFRFESKKRKIDSALLIEKFRTSKTFYYFSNQNAARKDGNSKLKLSELFMKIDFDLFQLLRSADLLYKKG